MADTQDDSPLPTAVKTDDDTSAGIQCPVCLKEMRIERKTGEFEKKCPVCQVESQLVLFPRFFLEPVEDKNAAMDLSLEGEATCQYYPELKAELICDECGCFLSKKASISWGDRDLCMPCLHQLREQKKNADFQAGNKAYDNRALALVTWLAPFTLFTAPLALFILIRHRKEGTGFIPRSSFRWWLAMVLSILWIIAWGIAITAWVSLIVQEITS